MSPFQGFHIQGLVSKHAASRYNLKESKKHEAKDFHRRNSSLNTSQFYLLDPECIR